MNILICLFWKSLAEASICYIFILPSFVRILMKNNRLLSFKQVSISLDAYIPPNRISELFYGRVHDAEARTTILLQNLLVPHLPRYHLRMFGTKHYHLSSQALS